MVCVDLMEKSKDAATIYQILQSRFCRIHHLKHVETGLHTRSTAFKCLIPVHFLTREVNLKSTLLPDNCILPNANYSLSCMNQARAKTFPISVILKILKSEPAAFLV